MTSLRFVGDIPLLIGLGLSAIVCVLAWSYYRRECHELSPRLRFVLPLLRSLAFLLGILILTGPVLHHRQVIGELGRIRIFVDASQSMDLADPHVPAGRKLLIAEQQEWLESGRLDRTLFDAANRLADVVGSLSVEKKPAGEDGNEPSVSNDPELTDAECLAKLQEIAESVAPKFPATAQFSDPLQEKVLQPLADLIEKPPSSAVELTKQRNTIASAALEFEQKLRTRFEQQVDQLLDSGDESAQAALALFEETNRWSRASRYLSETTDPLLRRLAENHDVEVVALQGESIVEFSSADSDTEPNGNDDLSPTSPITDLSSSLAGQISTQTAAADENDAADSEPVSATETKTNTAYILLTDGQHNSGPSPLESAWLLGQQGIPVHTVSFGAADVAKDLAVRSVDYPEMAFAKGKVRGTVKIHDQMPAGQPFELKILHAPTGDVAEESENTAGETVLWREQLVTTGAGERRVNFEFAIEELVQKITGELEPNVKHHAVPIKLTSVISPLQSESSADNNVGSMRFMAITENHRLLIMDGRPRWETRYLRNVFERDAQWDVNVILAGQSTDNTSLPRGTESGQFPETREQLFEYDLLVFGELSPELFGPAEQQWVREFVEIRGGGVIFIDGSRGHLAKFSEQPDSKIAPLLPVEWLPEPVTSQPTMLQLTDAGLRESALALLSSELENRNFWNELPPPHTIRRTKAAADSEVLVETRLKSDDTNALPAVVTRMFGAGRVLYLAFDETWRWRYKVADTWHQRIWNQLTRFAMPRGFATSDEFVSVDTGPAEYQAGDRPQIRVKLLGLDGKPASQATVDALVWKNDRIVSTVSLRADESVPGMYYGQADELVAGDYEVSIQASGFSREALQARGTFVVRPAETGELLTSNCNERLLRQIAASSGGTYLREEDIDRLEELVRPLSSGRVIESDTLLWQSYWWFGAMILLLATEWFLRKRAGML